MPALPVVHGEGARVSSSVHPEPGVRLRSSAARLRTFVATFIATFVETMAQSDKGGDKGCDKVMVLANFWNGLIRFSDSTA